MRCLHPDLYAILPRASDTQPLTSVPLASLSVRPSFPVVYPGRKTRGQWLPRSWRTLALPMHGQAGGGISWPHLQGSQVAGLAVHFLIHIESTGHSQLWGVGEARAALPILSPDVTMTRTEQDANHYWVTRRLSPPGPT